MTDSALHQFRIIDLTGGIAGQYGTKYFGDYGADVILVEPPRTGSGTRKTGPFLQDDPHMEKSLLFLYLNNNKRGVSLDISTPSGRDLVFELMRDADVVFEDYAPGHLESLGLGYEQVRALNPGVVFTSITPFGQYGPYRNYRGNDLLYYALGGMMYTSGSYDREPLKHGHPQTLYMGGMIAAFITGLIAIFCVLNVILIVSLWFLTIFINILSSFSAWLKKLDVCQKTLMKLDFQILEYIKVFKNFDVYTSK